MTKPNEFRLKGNVIEKKDKNGMTIFQIEQNVIAHEKTNLFEIEQKEQSQQKQQQENNGNVPG